MGRWNTLVSVLPMNVSEVLVLPEVEPLEDELPEDEPPEDVPPEVEPPDVEPPLEGRPEPLPVVSVPPFGK